MLFSKKYNTRSSRKRSMGKMISKKRNIMRGGSHVFVRDTRTGKIMKINIYVDDYVWRLCDKVEDMWPYANLKVSMTFHGKKLDERRTLGEYYIGRGDTIDYTTTQRRYNGEGRVLSLGME
jgi:hypothetical protein